MKRLILLSTFFVFIFISCDAPVSDVTRQSSQPDRLNVTVPAIPYSHELVQPDTARKAAWRQFQAQNGSEWNVRWNEHTGLPASVYSGLTQKAYSGSAEQAARSFLADYAGLFGFANLSSLEHVKTETRRGIRHVTFNQTVNGVPVYEAQYKVHLQGNGRVTMANGSFYPSIEVSTAPTVSTSAAVGRAKSDLDIPLSRDISVRSELVIYRTGEQFHLARKLILFSEDPLLDWLYFIDAHSGVILDKLNRLMDVTGDGDVYPTHPGLSSVTNKPLYRLAGNGTLQGTYANIVNDEDPEAFSSSNSFIYNPSNTHFDEVNLYYHVDNFRQNFINGLGSLGFTQITARAHYNHPLYGDKNAFFMPSSQEIVFGDASSDSTYIDFAKEDKVIYHEYGHAVIYDVHGGIESDPNEEGAISEGTPDYWAGSFTGRPVIGDYVVASHPDKQRDMDNPDIDTYSDYQNHEDYPDVEAHEGGEFFSSVLWDLRNSSVGASVTDDLVFESFYWVTSAPDFLEFRDAMLSADDTFYSDANDSYIRVAFADNGIGEYMDVTINGPTTVEAGETGVWTASVSSGFPPYDYQWYKNGVPVGTNRDKYIYDTQPSEANSVIVISVTVTDAQNHQTTELLNVWVSN